MKFPGLTLAGSGEFFGHSHEVGKGFRFHSAYRHRDIAVCGNKNDPNVDPRLAQLALKIHAAQPWHADIEYQAGGPLRPMSAKEFAGGAIGCSLHAFPVQPQVW